MASIPRLETVSEIIRRQRDPVPETTAAAELRRLDPVSLGVRLLRTALAHDELVAGGTPPPAAVAALRARPRGCDTALVRALEGLIEVAGHTATKSVSLADLRPGMVLHQDLRARTGMLLVGRGQEVSETVLARLHRFAETVGVAEPISVVVPA